MNQNRARLKLNLMKNKQTGAFTEQISKIKNKIYNIELQIKIQNQKEHQLKNELK